MTGFNKERNGVRGTVPESGAIFMSNTSTKRECFSRKLFGLPSSQVPFVEKVKEGMFLFLFEFEKRELHGVFRACCDGAVNIVPHAFNSSGKQFPAQVKFTQIWHCKPLSEDEFHDAVRDNYFSSKKFNFGLSSDQVDELLFLFSSRKLKDLPESQSTRSKVKRLIRNSSDKPRRSVDDCRLLTRDRIEYEADNNYEPFISIDYSRDSFNEVGRVDDGGSARTDLVGHYHKPRNDLGLVKSTEYLEDSFGNFGRGAHNDCFAATDRLGNECNLDIGSGLFISGKHPWYTSRKDGSVADDIRFATDDRSECGYNVDNGVGRTIPAEYPSLLRSSPFNPVCSSKPNLEIENTLVRSQPRSSSMFFRPIETQFDNIAHYHKDAMVRSSPSVCTIEPRSYDLSYTTSHQDAVITSSRFSHSIEPPFSNLEDVNHTGSLSYDPDAPSINLGLSSSFAVKRCSESAQEYAPRDDYAGNVFPYLKNRSFPTDVGPEGIRRCSPFHSGCGNYVAPPSVNKYESSCCRTSVPLSMVSYPKRRTVEFPENEAYESFSFSKPSLGGMLLSENGNKGGDNKDFSSYPSSPSSKHPSLMFDFGYPATLQDKYENDLPMHENRKAFTVSVPFSDDRECRMQGCAHPVDPRGAYCRDCSSVSHNVNNCLNSHNVSSNHRKNRNSVFSRLSLAPKVHAEKNSSRSGNNEYDMDKCVNEVMAMVPHNGNQWAKTKNSKLVTDGYDDIGNNRKKRQTTSCSKLERDCLAIISEEMNMNDTSAGEKRAEETPFVDFKRRSELRKVTDEKKSRDCVESAGDGAELGGQRKKRKLIRLNFSKIVPSDDNCVTDDKFQNLQLSSEQSSFISKNVGASCEALGETQGNVNGSSQNGEFPEQMCSIGCEGKNYNAERGLKCEVERKAESCEGSLSIGVEDE